MDEGDECFFSEDVQYLASCSWSKVHFFLLQLNLTACCFYVLLFKLSTIVELKPLFMSSQSRTLFEKSFLKYKKGENLIITI